MELVELNEADKQEYNNLVATNLSGSFLQSFEWGEWQKSLGREVHRFFINDDNNRLGSIQLIKMPIWGKKYYLYAPYGPVVEQNYELRISDYELLKNKFADSVFIRIEPKSAIRNPQSLIKTSNIQPAKTLIINLSKSEEELLAEMHQKTRYNIKVAQKHGVEIKDEFAITNGHGLFFEEALKLILETSKRQNFGTFPAVYYKKLADFFSLHNRGDLHLHIYKAIYQNQLLASAIMIDFGQTRTFLFGGSGDLHKNVMAPYLLHWQAMLDAKAQNLSNYDFWGIETSSGEIPGFVRFKLGFGGTEKEYAGAYDIINHQFFYKVYKLGRAANKITKSFRK